MPVTLVWPRLVEPLLSPFAVMAAIECERAKPFDVPLPLPLRAPATAVFALEDRFEPMAAVALPFDPYEPVATSLPVVDPVTLPRLSEKVLAPFGVLTATETSIECAATWPVPEPETEPATFELAVAESEPSVAVEVPLALKEAVPPVLLALPVETEPAIAAWLPIEVAKE